MIVPATPLWTVKDNFAHLAGGAADIVAGRIDGAGTDPWTGAQVEARKDRTLDELLDEFESNGPAMEQIIEAFGDALDPRILIDEWTHEQDIRGALGIPGGGESEVVGWSARRVLGGWARRATKAGLAPLVVHCDGEEYRDTKREPTGDPAAEDTVEVSVDAFTALRVTVGRRSARQLRELDWSGIYDPEPYFDRSRRVLHRGQRRHRRPLSTDTGSNRRQASAPTPTGCLRSPGVKVTGICLIPEMKFERRISGSEDFGPGRACERGSRGR